MEDHFSGGRPITVASSTGLQKNVDVTTGLTESKAGAALTNDIGTNYATKFAASDKLTFALTVDGASVGPITVAAGADGAALANNLNGVTAFGSVAVASYDATNKKLSITSKTTGATSNVAVNSVTFTDSAGAAQSKSGTGFVNVQSAGSAQASTAFPAGGITLDGDDTITLQIQVDTGTAKTITIDQALVNRSLAGVTNGAIGTAANFKTVVDAALSAAGLSSSVGTSLTGTGSDKLTFTSKTVGTDSKVLLSGVVASAGGGRTMSVDAINISSANLTTLGATTSDQVKKVLTAYINVVNAAITKVTTAAASLGSVASRIDMQKSFVDTLMDTIDKGVGNLVDADMSEESTRLQALQVKQQLGVQALSIANQAAQNILSLFK